MKNNMSIFSNKYFLIILRLVVGGVFLYASFSKLFNQEEFARAIYNYKLPFIDSFINIFAIVIPSLEFITGIFLILGIFTRGSSLLIAVLLILFIIFLAQAYARGLDISCGCFSLETVTEKSDILQRIVEDFFLLLATIMILKNSNKITIQETTQ